MFTVLQKQTLAKNCLASTPLMKKVLTMPLLALMVPPLDC